MRPEFQLILGTMLLAATLSYAWWVWFRVWMLRQDLFMIRDQLWDAMRAQGSLDNLAHRELRNSLNAFIRIAPLMSLWTFLRVIVEAVNSEGHSQTDIKEILEARQKTVRRILRYIFLETGLGLFATVVAVLVCLLILMPIKAYKSGLLRMGEKVMDSSELVSFGKFVEPGRPIHVG